jgi:meiotic recombination protein REC8
MKTNAPNPHAKEIEEVSQTYAANDWHGNEAAGVPVDGDGMEIDFNYNTDGMSCLNYPHTSRR